AVCVDQDRRTDPPITRTTSYTNLWRRTLDRDIAGLRTRRPALKRQPVEAVQVGRFGDLGRLASDDHAPAGPAALVDRVDFKRDPCAARDSVELTARIGTEYHRALIEGVVNWEDRRPVGIGEGQVAQV